MMAQCRAESTWEINNYGKCINLFPPNIIKSIRQYERINKKICRQKMSIMFNQTYIYMYIYIHHTSCESTCDTLPTRDDNTVSVAQGGTATPGATIQLLPPDRVLRELYIYIYIYICQIN